MATHEIVWHLDREFKRRPQSKSYTFGIDHNPKQYWFADYEKNVTLEAIGEDFSQRNARAGRELTYKIDEGILFWTLYYPNVKRKMTGYIKPSTGVPFKKRRRT